MNKQSRIRKHVITVNLCGSFRLHKNVYSVFIKGDLFGYTCGGRWTVLSETLNKIETQIHVERFLFNNARVTIGLCAGRYQGHLFAVMLFFLQHCLSAVIKDEKHYVSGFGERRIHVLCFAKKSLCSSLVCYPFFKL